ncbi:hypothetical protein ACOI1C_08955 [Bacillus sp. DJP31]|uniref:hypothetical protein n=1 Tax=Bacillus sp. DJP31 TaxID=3409789 RepID=UPI003BB527B5
MKDSKLLYILFTLLLLVGCSSIEDVVTETKDTVSKAFDAGSKGINVDKGSFSFYLPDSMEEKKNQDKQENNIILTEGKQAYILFINPLEKKDSRVVYESTLADQDYLLNETFEKDDQFGFVQVLEVDDKSFEVTVGVGGVKLTTVTKKNNVVKTSEKMMQIANSVRK